MYGVAEKLGTEHARMAAAGPHLTLRSAHADAPPGVPTEVAVAPGADPSADLTAADLDAIAGAVMERGWSMEQIANARGQSLPAMLVAIDKADRDKNSETGGRLDAITRGHETIIRMAISDLKGRALEQLVARIDEINDHPQRHTVQEHRAAEFARRLCFSLLRLDAFCAHHPDRRSSSEPPEPPGGRGPRLTYDARRERERRQRNGHDPSLYWYERGGGGGGGGGGDSAHFPAGDTPAGGSRRTTDRSPTYAPNAPPAPSRHKSGPRFPAGDTPAAGTESARASARGASPGAAPGSGGNSGTPTPCSLRHSCSSPPGSGGNSGTPTRLRRPSSHSNRGIVRRLTRRHKPIRPAVSDMAQRPRPP